MDAHWFWAQESETTLSLISKNYGESAEINEVYLYEIEDRRNGRKFGGFGIKSLVLESCD